VPDSQLSCPRETRVRIRNRGEDHPPLVLRQISSCEQAGDDERRKGKHFLKFERKKLRRIVRMPDLPRLVDQRRNQTQGTIAAETIAVAQPSLI